MTGVVGPSYAEIYADDASAEQTIGTGATYTKITAFTNDGLSNNCTAAASNDKITITRTGSTELAALQVVPVTL